MLSWPSGLALDMHFLTALSMSAGPTRMVLTSKEEMGNAFLVFRSGAVRAPFISGGSDWLFCLANSLVSAVAASDAAIDVSIPIRSFCMDLRK